MLSTTVNRIIIAASSAIACAFRDPVTNEQKTSYFILLELPGNGKWQTPSARKAGNRRSFKCYHAKLRSAIRAMHKKIHKKTAPRGGFVVGAAVAQSRLPPPMPSRDSKLVKMLYTSR